MGAKNRAIFVEECILRDEMTYTVDAATVGFRTGALESLMRVAEKGFKVFIFSRQPGVARGYFSIAQVEGFLQKLRDRLSQSGLDIEGAYYCPHHPHGRIAEYSRECNCSKTAPELFYRATLDSRLSLRQSWFIGNELDHIEGGRRAGCHTIMVYNGGEEKKWRSNKYRDPEFMASSVEEASLAILRQE